MSLDKTMREFVAKAYADKDKHHQHENDGWPCKNRRRLRNTTQIDEKDDDDTKDG